MTSLFVNRGNHVGREVNDLLQVLRRQVEQVAQTRGDTLEVPNVSNGSSQLNVAHALTAHLRACYFNTASLTHDALEAKALVLTAVDIPVTSLFELYIAAIYIFFRLYS